jgi:hypothetical protein
MLRLRFNCGLICEEMWCFCPEISNEDGDENQDYDEEG